MNYNIAAADGALRGAGGRPCVLVRYPHGVGGEFFFLKRAPAGRPDWVEVSTIHFPSGRTAEGVVPLWYRVRINLEHVPARLRPKEGKPS